MTEDEARKILKYLIRRIQRSFSTCIDKPTALNITKTKYNDIVVILKYTATSINCWRFLWANDKYNSKVVQLKGKTHGKEHCQMLARESKRL